MTEIKEKDGALPGSVTNDHSGSRDVAGLVAAAPLTTEQNRVTRPALRYLGGKWLLAPWIIGQFPPHRVYVEPFGGAASVLLRKPRSYAEIYNDLDADLVNLFEVLRDDDLSARLSRAISLTPFSREEFIGTYEEAQEPVERARRLVVRSFMGHGSNAANIERNTGFRADSNRNGTTPAVDWMNYPPAITQIAQRMRGVVVERRPALDIMRRFDRADTLHYVDPPYVHDTRSAKKVKGALYHAYRHELTEAQHIELLDCLEGLAGMVVVSGYPHPLYDARLKHWRRVTREAMADGAKVRTEVLWINPAAVMARGDLLQAMTPGGAEHAQAAPPPKAEPGRGGEGNA